MHLTRLGGAVLVLCSLGAASLAGGAPPLPPMELAVSEGAFSDDAQGSPRRNAAFERAKDLGATHIRGFFPWVHAPNGVYDDTYAYFPQWDSTIDEAIQRGFQVQLSLMGYASAEYGGADRTGVDPDPKEYAAFVTACAKHFRGRVRRYSIWNEPNLPVFLMPRTSPSGGTFVGALGGTKPSPASYEKEILPANAKRYRELFFAGYAAIKAVDPSAQVLIGELSSSHDPIRFMEQMAPEGTRIVADGFAHHPYQFTVAPDAPPNRYGTGAGISKVNLVQLELQRLAKARRLTTPGGGKLPLYLTEFGYQKLEGRAFVSSNQVSEATRAEWLPKAFEVAREAGARQMLYFMLLPTPPTYPWDTSIVDARGEPLPCFRALKAWARAQGYATR